MVRAALFAIAVTLLLMSIAAYGMEPGVERIPVYDGCPGADIGDTCVNSRDGAVLMWVPSGWFIMGSTSKQIEASMKVSYEDAPYCMDDEWPQRKFYLDGYWIYKYEVTVKQYRKFCEETGRDMPDEPDWGWRDDLPIVNVDWFDADAYARWAGVALPTEAQWEKAARGTDGRLYPWGDEWPPPKGACNFCEGSFNDGESEVAVVLDLLGYPPTAGYDDGFADASPVGSFPKGVSPYGCMDMAGNVWEWCADWYDPNYLLNMPNKNPFSGMKWFGGRRSLRGGSWHASREKFFRCAYRNEAMPDHIDYVNGIRCVSSN